MDSSVHAFVVAQHIQERMATAACERLAREVRSQAESRRRPHWIRLRRRAVVAVKSG